MQSVNARPDMIPCTSFDELLVIELDTGVRYEMWGGYARRMEGDMPPSNSANASLIAMNTMMAFWNRLSKPYQKRVNARVPLGENDYHYADALVAQSCDDFDEDGCRAPLLIASVQSPEDGSVFRRPRPDDCIALPSLLYHLTLMEERMEIVFRSRETGFRPTIYGEGASLAFPEFRISVPVDEFYERIDLQE